MHSDPIITVSGLRGIVGESLTPEVAQRYAVAFAATLGEGAMLITHDARRSAAVIEEAIAGAIAGTGRGVELAGPASTPTHGVLIRRLPYAGGIQISASHNPPEYNGMKLFAASGRVLPAEAGGKVLEKYHELARQTDERSSQHSATNTQAASITRIADSLSTHCERVLDIVNTSVIRQRKYRVLVDANHGAGGPLAEILLNELGCDVVTLGARPDAEYEHPLEPTEENLQATMALARESKCDVTFCQDPDADRLAVIDENGRYLGEELTLALCMDHVLRQTSGPVVVNCSSSKVTEDIAAKYGSPYIRAKVGEANVVDEMLANKAVLGGEGNGGVIDPRVGFVRDSFVGMALILEALTSRELPVSAMADELPRYSIHKTKVPLAASEIGASFDRLEEHFVDATPSRLDGLRLDWDDCWLLIRASNTEPIVRIIAEARSQKHAEELCSDATRVISK